MADNNVSSSFLTLALQRLSLFGPKAAGIRKPDRCVQVIIDISGSMDCSAEGVVDKWNCFMKASGVLGDLKKYDDSDITDFKIEGGETRLQAAKRFAEHVTNWTCSKDTKIGGCGLTVFNHKSEVKVAMAKIQGAGCKSSSRHSAEMINAIDALKTSGATALYDAIVSARQQLEIDRQRYGFQEAMLIVITDGEDNCSSEANKQLCAKIKSQFESSSKKGNVSLMMFGMCPGLDNVVVNNAQVAEWA